MNTKSTELRNNKIWIEDDGIIRVVVNGKARQNLSDSEETITVNGRLLEKNNLRMVPCSVDLNTIVSIEKGARNHYSGIEAARVLSALTLIIDSLVSKVIGNFFLGINNMDFSTLLFIEDDEAMEGLKGFLK